MLEQHLTAEATERNTMWYDGLLSDQEYFGWINAVLGVLYQDATY